MARFLKQAGVTLLEVLFVLAIGASLLMIGLRQYFTFKLDADVAQVKANVDKIFQAMAFYYYANCTGEYLYRTSSTCAARLDPRCTGYISNNIPINIQSDLATNGYLDKWPLPISPILGTGGSNGYIAQFNWSQTTRTVSKGTGSGTYNVGTIITWQAQVAVNIKNSAQAELYKNLLGGDCTSSLSGNLIAPCSSNSSGPYVVWARLPSTITSNTPGWSAMPLIKQFNQMYTTW